MGDITDVKVLKGMLRKYNVMPKKRLGQNFIIDRTVILKIVEALQITNDDVVIEIGPGMGALTKELCEHAKMVIAVEIDETMISILREQLSEYSNIEIIKNDILKTDINAIVSKYVSKSDFNCKQDSLKIKVVGNLPYYITTPIIMGLLEKRLKISQMVFMTQKEVAQRIVSDPGVKDYGVLSVMAQYYCAPSIMTYVSADSFMPRPEVESAVVKLTMKDKPDVVVKDEKMYFNVVRAGFNQRRKTLINAISNSASIDISKQDVKNILWDLGMSENIRGEELSPYQFALLSDEIYNLGKITSVL